MPSFLVVLPGPAGTPQIYGWEFDQPIIYLKTSLPEALNDTATGTDSEALVKILSHGGSRCGATLRKTLGSTHEINCTRHTPSSRVRIRYTSSVARGVSLQGHIAAHRSC